MKITWFNSRNKLAIAQAYAAFAQRYPQWRVDLFDRPFLERRMGLLKGNLPDAQSLALCWADHVGLSEPSRSARVAELMPAAAFFLQTLGGKMPATSSLAPARKPL